jgi:hypothetical protein
LAYQQILNGIAKFIFGTSAIESIIAKDGEVTPKNLKKHFKRNARIKKLDKQFGQGKIHLEALYRSCIEHIRSVTAPLVLISQIQRSGGTLLSQLFDGHPEIHAHPHELKIGYPTKYTWPKIDLSDNPDIWLETLFEYSVLSHFKKGYKKEKKRDDAFLFLFLPSVQREIFLDYVGSIDSLTLRDIFDGYMTSYFGAWLNNQNSSGNKKFITAFTARLAMNKDNMESFFGIYPDGKLISIIRDPRNWYPSAVRHKPRICRGVRDGINLWKNSAKAILWNKHTYGDRVCILTFEDLVVKTKSVMLHLADFLKIKFDEILLEPTFNKYPIRANTSFEAERNGIINSTLQRYKTLTRGELEFIESTSKELYGQLLSLAVRF